ncbi:MAG: Nif3-like dinuclear metal center hexameric protein [Clostridia bacterium]|nr:Nif3-like dinuclear metal center hexameric protein [Clostridia bacterium]
MKCKPTVNGVFEYINSIAPFEKQCEWDNSGLIVGDPAQEVKKIGVVLDITTEAVRYAAENGIELIVSHHPVIFRAVKSVLANDPTYLLIKHGISAICAHTSLDIAKGGVNDALAETLGFKNAASLSDSGETEMIRVCKITETTAGKLSKHIAEKLSTGVMAADCGKAIRKIALCGGAGGDFLHAVAQADCDAYITGEAKHHEFLEAHELGITLLTAGHFETENPVVAVLAEKLKKNFGCEIEIIPQSSPVKYF